MSPHGFTSKLNLLTSSVDTKLCDAPLSTKDTAEEAAYPQDSVHILFHVEAVTGFQLALLRQKQFSELLGFVHAVYGQHWCCAKVSHARGNRAPAWQMPLGDQCLGKGHTQGQNK